MCVPKIHKGCKNSEKKKDNLQSLSEREIMLFRPEDDKRILEYNVNYVIGFKFRLK